MSKRFLGIFLPEEFFSSENLRPDRQEFKSKSTHFWNNLTVITNCFNEFLSFLSWWFSEKTLEIANSEFNYRLFLKGLDLVRRWETKLVCDQYKSRINFRNNISFVQFFIWRTETVLIRLHSNSSSADCFWRSGIRELLGPNWPCFGQRSTVSNGYSFWPDFFMSNLASIRLGPG